MTTSIADNLARTGRALALAATAAGRAAGAVHLIAVSKRQPAESVLAAAAAGQLAFGENYLQEAEPKITAVRERLETPLTWHFIGAIQSNKTRRIAELFDWVHTVDRARIAHRLSEHCPPGKTLQVCLQVNVDADPAKAGVSADGALALLRAVRDLPGLAVRGLMTIRDPAGEATASFARLAALFESLRPEAPECWNVLSMGMSDDFAAAIAAGATHVRIGTAIFGARS